MSNLAERRTLASELSGGTSSDCIKDLILRLLKAEQATGSLIDFGAGKGELLTRLHQEGGFAELAGADLFPRPNDLPADVGWIRQDLNEPLTTDRRFDVVVCSETIEHLENPRHVFRTLYALLKPQGLLVLTMPNQESIRSFVGLLIGGHFVHFLGACYPAHITALLRLDLRRMCDEAGFTPPTFHFTNHGGVPKMPRISWQKISCGILRGRLFSDNLAMVARKP